MLAPLCLFGNPVTGHRGQPSLYPYILVMELTVSIAARSAKTLSTKIAPCIHTSLDFKNNLKQ